MRELQITIRNKNIDFIELTKYQMILNVISNFNQFRGRFILFKIQMLKFLFVFCLLLSPVFSVLTSRMAAQKYKLKSSTISAATNQTTQCNIVDLSSKYNYTGIVRTGYLNVGKGNSVLAFMFYGRKDIVDVQQLKNIPTILWLNGGPGSSSQYGNMQEIGPLLIKREFDVKIVSNPYSWVTKYNVLFVDQPVGTGLSYADQNAPKSFVTNMDEVANDFYFALDQLYNSNEGCFSAMKLNIPPSAPLIIFGESYGGKYAPAIAKKIVSMLDNRGFLTGLKGVAIGDGFTYPYEIMSELGTYSFHLSLLDYQQRTRLQRILLNGSRHNLDGDLKLLKDDFDNALDLILDRSEVNVYNVFEDGDYEEFLPNYFTTPEIIKLYGLNSAIVFDSQGEKVYNALSLDFMKPEPRLVEYLLAKNISVLIYNGQDDLIVQSTGTMKWVDNLFYPQSSEFRNALFSPWHINGKVVGSIKKAGLLEFRIVNKAGHLVPMDRPVEALDLVTSFVSRIV